MFKPKREEIKATPTQPQQSIQTIIGSETVFEGTVTTKSPMRVDGVVKGDIDSVNTVIVGSTGEINGTVKANDLYIAGTVNGDVEVSGKTEFVSGGYLHGNLATTDLIMENGASFDGMCKTKNQNNMEQKLEIPETVAN